MSEIRKHYFLDEWVVINEKRGQRPKQFKHTAEAEKDRIDFFAPGNEKLTPPEIGRVEEKGSWKIRWFDNKFPIFASKNKDFKVKKGYFQSAPGVGFHEVIVETPDSEKQLWDLSVRGIHDLLKVYSLRTSDLLSEKNVEYVQIFKNHGAQGGTSLVHSHTQLITLPMVPLRVQEKVIAAKKLKRCPYAEILKKEKKSKRIISQNKTFAAIAPYCSRFNYEAWIIPKKHITSIVDFNDNELFDLAELLSKILKKLKFLNCSYNYAIINSPKKGNLRFHLEIMPRIATWAGFEIATDVIVNSVSPESAAKFFRKK